MFSAFDFLIFFGGEGGLVLQLGMGSKVLGKVRVWSSPGIHDKYVAHENGFMGVLFQYC